MSAKRVRKTQKEVDKLKSIVDVVGSLNKAVEIYNGMGGNISKSYARQLSYNEWSLEKTRAWLRSYKKEQEAPEVTMVEEKHDVETKAEVVLDMSEVIGLLKKMNENLIVMEQHLQQLRTFEHNKQEWRNSKQKKSNWRFS
jgi:hypothetical protein